MGMKSLFAGFIAVTVMAFSYDAKAVVVTTEPDDGPNICLNCAIGSVTNFTDEDVNAEFAHAWTFSTDTASNLGFALENEDEFGQNINDLQLFVYDADPTGDNYPGDAPFGGTLLGSTSVVASGAVEFLFLNNIAAGTYWALVVGSSTATAGGAYTGTLQVSAVPLPPAIWLFISALVGLVSFARIRRNGTPA